VGKKSTLQNNGNSKSIFSEPSAIISAKGVDISQTYGHLYEVNPDNDDEFRCKLCLRVALLLKSSKEPKALEAITNLTAFLNCKSRSHIVAHLAIKHPEHLVEDFPANCKAHQCSAWMPKYYSLVIALVISCAMTNASLFYIFADE
jgi:hypothetical protein